MLAVEHISRQFGGIAALTDVSFEIQRDSITAMVGPNGAGKTTMFNIASGVIRPTSGRVWLEGKDVTGWSPHEVVACGLARTWQAIQLFPNLSVLENVMLGRNFRRRSGVIDALLWSRRHRRESAETRERAGELLTWLGMYDKRFSMPNEISYGYRRRLEIARALATEPSVLMLDEPTAGLRAHEAGQLVELVGRLKGMGKAVFLIEHNMNVVKSIADRVLVLNFGRTIADGTPTHVLADREVIDAYLGSEE